jgi:oxygen-independent coproporphyrinogen-3 oxidase
MDSISQLKRFGLFDANVPRYTSYPPANQFACDVTPDLHRQWIRAIPPGSKISLYVHVPFCRRLCWFCACRTQGMKSDGPVVAYTDTLIQEIKALSSLLPENVEVAKLHWGGGTPTLLQAPEMTRLAEAIRRYIPLSEGAEFSVEVDPNEIDETRLDALAEAGMRRASIGVQDFDPDIQKIIGREQTFEVTQAAVDGLRARGVASLNTDLLYGLPFQTQERITSSMQMLLSLNPDRVALYGYAHVPWMAKRQTLIPTEALPAPEMRLKLFETAEKILRWDRYERIGIDHFAQHGDTLAQAQRDGRLRRNFQGYTDDTCDVLLGVGASSISKFPQGFVQNAASTAAYQKAVRAGDLATGRGHALSDDDILRSAIIEQLMCNFRFNRTKAPTLPSQQVDRILDDLVQAFDGHVTRTADGVSIGAPSRPLTRLIARHVDAYTTAQSSSHSSAI